MTTKTPAPARLFVLLAREAPVGVILRRGPSNWVQMIHWDTKQDVFTPGQWFHGRVYARKSDLSPDGKLIVYYAHKFNNSIANPSYGDYWTAISKPPYFTALTLWRHSGDSGGGGQFLKNDNLFLNHLYQQTPHVDHQIPDFLHVIQADDYTYLGDEIFADRLSRDGWYRKGLDKSTWSKTFINFRLFYHVSVNRQIFRHPPKYAFWPYAQFKVHQYRILGSSGIKEYHLPGITWADFDQHKRLIVARQGKLFSAAVENGELNLTELADFNANKPEALEAPEWAKKW